MSRLFSMLLALPLLGASPEQEIRAVMNEQVTAWNRGDIPGFMDGYEKSALTTFIGDKITRGHAQVLASYLVRYPSREKMGTLQFTDLEIRPLGAEYASLIGRFHLDRSAAAGGSASGIFSLVFRKTAQGWRIILDHTSDDK